MIAKEEQYCGWDRGLGSHMTLRTGPLSVMCLWASHLKKSPFLQMSIKHRVNTE